MKITSIEIIPDNSSLGIELSFRDPASLNPFQIQSVTGLDIDQAVPRSYRTVGRLPTISKSVGFYNLSLLKRQIVMKIGLNPNYEQSESFAELRDILYRIVASSRTGKVNLFFKNKVEVVAVLSGFIAKSENPLFEKTQTVQLSIQCDDPMLRSPDPITITGIAPRAPVVHGDTLVMPTPGEVTTVVDDKSTAPHGFQFVLDITGSLTYIQIVDPDDNIPPVPPSTTPTPTWFFKVQPAGGFINGDKLYFSSEDNNKYLYIIRESSTIQLADSIVVGSDWPIMFPGENTFAFNDNTNLVMEQLQYYATYWGV